METADKWNIKSKIGRIMLGLVLAAVTGSIYATPSFADNDRGHGGKHDKGRYEHRDHGYDRDYRDYRVYRDHRDYRDYRVYRVYRDHRGSHRRVYRTYGYRERVYVAPPVIYAPPPPPGINIMFPPLFFRL